MTLPGPVDGEALVDRLLFNISLVQLRALSPEHPVITRIDLTRSDALVRVTEGDGTERWFGPLSFAVDRPALVQDLVIPARMPLPDESWATMDTIPYGTDRPWKHHWAALLLDIAQYGFAIREEPYNLRYERIELVRRPESGSVGEAAVSVVDASGGGPSAVTTVPVPVPLASLEQVVGIGFTIREWIREGRGETRSDGSRLWRLGNPPP